MKNHLTRSAFSSKGMAIFFKIAPHKNHQTSHFLFEKRPIVDFHRGNEREEHGFHTIEAQTVYPLQTLFPACKIAIFLSHRSLLKILCIDKIGSRPRRILCVEKIAARPRGKSRLRPFPIWKSINECFSKKK